jgi:ABC-type branched-subunit amino acid transport system ATPase component
MILLIEDDASFALQVAQAIMVLRQLLLIKEKQGAKYKPKAIILDMNYGN